MTCIDSIVNVDKNNPEDEISSIGLWVIDRKKVNTRLHKKISNLPDIYIYIYNVG